MNQFTQNKIESVSGGLSGLMSAFKSKIGGTGSSSGNMFASLLDATQASLPQVESLDPSVSPSARRSESATDEGNDAAMQERADTAASRSTVDADRAPRKADRDSGESSAKAQAPGNDKKLEKTEPKDDARETQKAQDDTNETQQTTAQGDTSATASCTTDDKDDQDEDALDAELAALMAALLPLDEKAAKVAANASETTGTTQTTETTKAEELVANLDAMIERLTEKTEEKAAKIESKIEKIVADVGKIGDGIKQALSEVEGKVEKAVDDKLAPVLEGLDAETKSVYSEMIDAAKASQQKGGAGMDQAGQQNNGQGLKGSEQQNVLAGAMTSAPANATATQGADLAQNVQGAGKGDAASTNLLSGAGGVRTAGSYDFASQLSAARVTKGGTAGLPQAVEQVSVQLHKAVKEGLDQITIQLRPAELGKIEVKLEFGADKSVTGTVIADNQATLNMLQKDSGSLQRALQEAGLQADAGCMQFSLRDESQSGRFAQNQSNNASSSALRFGNEDGELDGASDIPTANETYYITPGRVNLRV